MRKLICTGIKKLAQIQTGTSDLNWISNQSRGMTQGPIALILPSPAQQGSTLKLIQGWCGPSQELKNQAHWEKRN